MINVTTLILKLSISHFLMVMFLALHPIESISLNSFVFIEHVFNTCNKLLTQKLLKETKSATMNIFRFFFIFFLNHL